MNMKNETRAQSCNPELKTSLTLSAASGPGFGRTASINFKFWSCMFHFSFLVFCLSTSLTGAEISSEQLDPIDFLVAHLAKLSQDVNTPNVPTPLAKLQSAPQEQSQTNDTTPVNFTAQATCRSERSEESLVMQRPVPSALSQDDSKRRRQLPKGSLPLAGNPNSHLTYQLWRARISTPKSERDNRSKNELQQIIEQIRSVKFEPKDQPSEPMIVVEPVPTAEPNETLSDTETLEEPEGKEIESKLGTLLPYEPVTDQTLQMLENLLQHPDQLDNPFELGEVLFRSGRLKEAAVFYREALNRTRSHEAASAQDRAWILLQIGNCLRDDDPIAAMKVYRQLITEYPDSLWTDLAKVRNKLIDWYQKDKPQALIAENQ